MARDTAADRLWQLGCESVGCDGCDECGVHALHIINHGCGHCPDAVLTSARVTPAVLAAAGARARDCLRALGTVAMRTGTRAVARWRGARPQTEDIVWIHLRVEYNAAAARAARERPMGVRPDAVQTVLADPRWRVAGCGDDHIDLLLVDNLLPRVRL